MNAKEVAKMLGAHPNTIYKMIKNGEIKAVKQGKSFDIPSIEVNKLMVSKHSVDTNKETEKGAYALIQHFENKMYSEFSRIAIDCYGVAQDFLKMKNEEDIYKRIEMESDIQNGRYFIDLLETVEKYISYKKMCERLKETAEDPLLHESLEEQVAWHNALQVGLGENNKE
ncbi:DNA binding domain-containing protein, excisionase family [Bacillus sp. ok061]|uniref:helix-turn-helix domain-containing protein n=1 Tax=Bacillus sp. ok061 TaxID=1761766 RepID=UPI00089F3DD4|nr:helix-turn-helix domain-containing protein [Bacillus sp. ok061]SEG88983.1 DNA binding domain-containing protein, excisionase family [Bacillus sp. ok061]